MHFRSAWDKISNWLINKDLSEIIFLHISNGSEIPFICILKLFFDTFVRFLKRGVNYYLPLNWEYSGFRFINDSSKKEKMGTMNRWQ